MSGVESTGRPVWLATPTTEGPSPYSYTVPASLIVEPITATATFDGTTASGQFLCCLSLYSQTGNLLSRTFPSTIVASGGVALVSYAPFLRCADSGTAASSSGFSGGVGGSITPVGSGTTSTTSLTGTPPVSASVNKPTGVAAGDLLLVLLGSYWSAGPFGNLSLGTIPSGWGIMFSYNLVAQTTGGAAGAKSARACLWKVADGTEGATLGPFVVTKASSAAASVFLCCRAYRGIDTAALGTFASNLTGLVGASPQSVVAPSVAGVRWNSLSVLAVTCPAAYTGGTWALPSGYSYTASVNNAGGTRATFFAEENPVTSAPPETLTISGSSLGGGDERYAELTQIILNPLQS